MCRQGRWSLITVLLVVSLVTACGQDGASLDPPKIRYGEDISVMGMSVVDPRYTVATLPEDADEWLLFDDIGEFFKYRESDANTELQVIWVNDYRDEEWFRAQDAWYLASSELKSPMGWGIAAFRSDKDAMEMQDKIGGELMTWEDVQAREWIAPPAPANSAADHTATPENAVTPGRNGRDTN